MAWTPYNAIIPYSGFTQFTPTLPKFYWDVYSDEQRFKHLCKELHKLVCYADMLGENINIDHKIIDELEKEFDKFKESGFDDYYRAQFEQWFKDNIPQLFTLFVKQVYFGLTDDGYFCAYVPESWSDIEFDTGAQYGKFAYGRLILRFNADGSGVIDNTGRYDEKSAAEFNHRIKQIENTLHKLLSEGGN